jgi:polysaccharide export outer membrane protein
MIAATALVLLSAFGPGAPVQPTPSAPPLAQDYQLGPDDILKIAVYGHDDLTQVVVVQADGTFTFPLIGRVQANDLTPKQLENRIATALAQGFVRNPQVNVTIQEYRSKPVFVVGELTRPGTYPLSGSKSLVEMLARAGPMTNNAGYEVVIVRPKTSTGRPLLPSEASAMDAKAGAEVIRVNLRELQSGDLGQNVILHANDTVFVPQAPKVFVSGEVRSPGAYAFAPGMTVRQVISLAGGFTDFSATGRIRVVRTVDGKAKELKVKLDDAVQSGDTVVVKEKLF